MVVVTVGDGDGGGAGVVVVVVPSEQVEVFVRTLEDDGQHGSTNERASKQSSHCSETRMKSTTMAQSRTVSHVVHAWCQSGEQIQSNQYGYHAQFLHQHAVGTHTRK